MATWPLTLPAPNVASNSVTFGSNAMQRTTQAGRLESIRYGSGAPDQWTVTLRLKAADVAAFEQFYDRDLNQGLNWFSASWIADDLGYTDHMGKILGYPRVKVFGKLYRDYALTILIKPTANCPADTSWPVRA